MPVECVQHPSGNEVEAPAKEVASQSASTDSEGGKAMEAAPQRTNSRSGLLRAFTPWPATPPPPTPPAPTSAPAAPAPGGPAAAAAVPGVAASASVVPEPARQPASHEAATPWDEEAGNGGWEPVKEAAAGADAEGMEKPAPKGRRCTMRRRLQWCGATLAVIVGLAMLLWPRDPSWELKKLDIDTGKFVTMMSGGGAAEPISFTADAEFWNPNMVGSTTEPGHFTVFYDSQVIGHGTTSSCEVGPRSTGNVHVDITMDLGGGAGEKLVQDVLAHDFELTVDVHVHTVARAAFIKVQSKVHCRVRASAKRLFKRPEDVIVDRQCSYTYSL